MKEDIKIAAAQINSSSKEIEKNLFKHLSFIKKAADNSADIIMFPELSLSSYHRDKSGLIFSEKDPIFLEFEKLSRTNNIIIQIGAPIKKEEKVFIASVVFYPNGKRVMYFKNNLHEGEDVLYSGGDESVLIDLKGERIALGICYDIEIEDHIIKAKKQDATIYASSIFYSANSTEDLCQKVKDYTNKYKMDFIVSNFTGEVWNSQSGGKSMYWTKNGHCSGICSKDDEAILYCTKTKDNYKTEIVI